MKTHSMQELELDFVTTLWGRYYYCAYFVDEEAEVRRASFIQSNMTRMQPSWDLNSGNVGKPHITFG